MQPDPLSFYPGHKFRMTLTKGGESPAASSTQGFFPTDRDCVRPMLSAKADWLELHMSRGHPLTFAFQTRHDLNEFRRWLPTFERRGYPVWSAA